MNVRYACSYLNGLVKNVKRNVSMNYFSVRGTGVEVGVEVSVDVVTRGPDVRGRAYGKTRADVITREMVGANIVYTNVHNVVAYRKDIDYVIFVSLCTSLSQTSSLMSSDVCCTFPMRISPLA